MIFLGIKYELLSDTPVIKICEWAQGSPSSSQASQPVSHNTIVMRVEKKMSKLFRPAPFFDQSASNEGISSGKMVFLYLTGRCISIFPVRQDLEKL